MNNKTNKLINPIEVINSTLDECTDAVVNNLVLLSVNKLSGRRTIEFRGVVYNIDIEIKILKV